MNIQLRNIEASDTLGRNGTVWQGTIYIEGTKVGKAYNYGDGGETMWDAIDDKGQALIKQAEKWAKKQPPYTSSIIGTDKKPIKARMNLSLYLELQISKYLDQKQLRKEMKNSIVYGVPDSGTWTRLSFKEPIATLLANKLYLGALALGLQTKVFPNMGKGAVILKTNIPEEFHERLAIKKGQIVPQESEKHEKRPQKTQGDDVVDKRQSRPRKR